MALPEADGLIVCCGADFNHDGQTHQNVVGPRRMIWRSASLPTLAAL